MIQPLRVAVAGMGFGGAVHVPGLMSIPNVEVVAVAARRLERAQAVAARFGVGAAVASIDELLDRDLDAVAIALQPADNARVAALALDRGLAVLCEKPIAADAATAAALAERAAGRVTAVNFQFGELPALRLLAERIAGGALGRLHSVHVTYLNQSRALRHGAWSWKLDAAEAGGVMAMFGAHLLHLLELLTQEKVMRLRATFDRRANAAIAPPGARPAEDGACLWMEGANGLVATMMVSNACPGSTIHRWDLVGELGTAILENLTASAMNGFTLSLTDADGNRRELWRDGAEDASEDGRLAPFRSLAARFTAAVTSGTPCYPSFKQGARVQRLLDAAAESDRTGTALGVA